jgi:hypothetical protein
MKTQNKCRCDLTEWEEHEEIPPICSACVPLKALDACLTCGHDLACHADHSIELHPSISGEE